MSDNRNVRAFYTFMKWLQIARNAILSNIKSWRKYLNRCYSVNLLNNWRMYAGTRPSDWSIVPQSAQYIMDRIMSEIVYTFYESMEKYRYFRIKCRIEFGKSFGKSWKLFNLNFNRTTKVSFYAHLVHWVTIFSFRLNANI